MIAIVDYGVGNLFSVKSSFAAIGAEAVVTSDPAVIRAADHILLPGVGAYRDAAQKLRDSGMAASSSRTKAPSTGVKSLLCSMRNIPSPTIAGVLGITNCTRVPAGRISLYLA